MKIKELHSKYERYISPLSLLAGFIADNLTLRRIDLLAENIAILSYLFIVGASILILNAYDVGRLRGKIIDKLYGILPFVMQFAFGGLFSVFVVFYFRSASFFASWPFLLALAGLLVGNEIFRKRYSRLVFQLSIYFVVIFSYSVFAMPIVLKKINDTVFLLSGLASIALISLFIFIIWLVLREKLIPARGLFIKSIAGIYLLFNIFYFANIIPPIPLSLKESGIYHSVARLDGNYIVQFEPSQWSNFFNNFNRVFHWKPGEPVYCYSAVFAPAKINTEILHRWSYFNEEKKEWEEKSRLGFPIVGGRDGGYRGYSVKYQIEPGKWRVDVITGQDKILGRINFEIVEVGESPKFRAESR